MRHRIISSFIIVIFLLSPGCLSTDNSTELDSNDSDIELTVWHSFAAESKEQATFESRIEVFMASNPGVEVKISAIPYPEADQQFMIAAQGEKLQILYVFPPIN